MKKLLLTAIAALLVHTSLLAQDDYDYKLLRYFRDYIETGSEFPRKPELSTFFLKLSKEKNTREVFANALTEYHENREHFANIEADSVHLAFRVGDLNRIGFVYDLYLLDTTKSMALHYYWKGYSDWGPWLVPDSTVPVYMHDSDSAFSMQMRQIFDFLREGISPPSCLTNRFQYNIAINNRYSLFKERVVAEGFRISREQNGELSFCFDKTRTYCYLKVDFCPYYFPRKEADIYFLVQEIY